MTEREFEKEVHAMVVQSGKRMSVLKNNYNPITGEGAELYDPNTNEPIYKRKRVEIEDHIIPVQFLPEETRHNTLYKDVLKCGSIREYIIKVLQEEPTDEIMEEVQRQLMLVRYKTDFICWAYLEWKIKDKKGEADNIHIKTKIQEMEDDDDGEIVIDRSDEDYSLIPFKLNYAQMILLATFEMMRLKGEPIRVILVKCRQWGGSTLTQVYMAWIQLLLMKGWYSVIIAQVSSTAKKIYMMYEKGIGQYSSWLLGLDDGQKLRFSQYGKSSTDNRITYGTPANPKTARDTVVSIGTYNNPDNMPGSDISLIHLSEVALWKKTDGREPEDVVKSVAGGLYKGPLSMLVMESTPRGPGNYFAMEYKRAKDGESAFAPVYIPCYKNIYDIEKVNDKKAFARWILENKDNDDRPEHIPEHEKFKCKVSGMFIYRLWTLGATLENIMWYLLKHLEHDRHSDMASEASIDDVEAFQSTDTLAFNIYDIENMERMYCMEPKRVGDICSDYSLGASVLENYEFTDKPEGPMMIWEEPNKTKMFDQYIVTVDIGGNSKKADWSVIRVVDRTDLATGGCEKTVLLWSGHIHHDYLAWKAVQIAKWYNDALLVFEANTLETRDKNRIVDEGDPINYILEKIDFCYDNLYMRTSKQPEDLTQKRDMKYGFHTNRYTKPTMIKMLDEAIRKADFIERDAVTYSELKTYENNEGVYEAMAGCKDDRLMTLAIAIYLSRSTDIAMDMPRVIPPKRKAEEIQYERYEKNAMGAASF